jgi:hypothetical protein
MCSSITDKRAKKMNALPENYRRPTPRLHVARHKQASSGRYPLLIIIFV